MFDRFLSRKLSLLTTRISFCEEKSCKEIYRKYKSSGISLLVLILSSDGDDPLDEILILGVGSESNMTHGRNLYILTLLRHLDHGSCLNNTTSLGTNLLKFCLVLQV